MIYLLVLINLLTATLALSVSLPPRLMGQKDFLAGSTLKIAQLALALSAAPLLQHLPVDTHLKRTGLRGGPACKAHCGLKY